MLEDDITLEDNIKLSFSVNKSKVIIDNNLIFDIGKYFSKEFSPRKILIISDINIGKLYLEPIKTNLEKLNFQIKSFILNPGEASKTLDNIKKIYYVLSSNCMSRTDIIMAVGGGIVTDIAGFVASTYKRGMHLISIPTTLLAQIDASIGGKNGVNTEFGKNMIGTFYQPDLILIDPKTLETLPENELNCGIAEAIKCGCIRDKKLFEFFEILGNQDFNKSVFKKFAKEIIYKSILVKKELVEEDMFDLGARMLLNFGHTVGHALEKLKNYQNLSHGQAVSIGMNVITQISEKLGLTEIGAADRLRRVCEKYHLPTGINSSFQGISEIILHDKKVFDDYLNLVLIKNIGDGYIYKINSTQIINFFDIF